MTEVRERSYQVTLTKTELDALWRACDQVPRLLGNAVDICAAMQVAIDGELIDKVSLSGLLAMSWRGFDAAIEREGAALAAMGKKLTPVFARSVNDSIDAERERRAEALSAGARRASTQGGHDDD